MANEGVKIKEATLVAQIHTVKSGHIKTSLGLIPTQTNKVCESITLKGNLVELVVIDRAKKELILVPLTYFSHLVPMEQPNG